MVCEVLKGFLGVSCVAGCELRDTPLKSVGFAIALRVKNVYLTLRAVRHAGLSPRERECMARSVEVTRTTRGALTGDEAERLLSTVDETGHSNEERARKQRLRRERGAAAVEIDPLSGKDPSGADTDRVITRYAMLFVSVFVVLIVLIQVGWGYVRRVTTATLAEDASMRSVVRSLGMGVEWGGGFTQFPAEFTVQEADERTHRIEVSVIDADSSSELEAFATAQVQATALSVNAMLNPNIDTVVYHVKVRRDEDGRFLKSQLFGFMRPTGAATPFMTFIWTKTAAEDGVRFDCSITGVDAATQESLHDAITSKSTPATIINYVMGDNDEAIAQHVIDATHNNEGIAEGVEEMLDEVARRKVEEEKAKAEEKDEKRKSEAEVDADVEEAEERPSEDATAKEEQ